MPTDAKFRSRSASVMSCRGWVWQVGPLPTAPRFAVSRSGTLEKGRVVDSVGEGAGVAASGREASESRIKQGEGFAWEEEAEKKT